jgi:alpha-tubulin suppressor-like RCC1 family protein
VHYALRRDGTVWSWTARCRFPEEDEMVCRYGQVRQIQGVADVIQIAAGRAFAIALKRDGTVWGWGDNTVGQLGDTAETLRIGLGQRDDLEKHHPVRVWTPLQVPVLKDIVRISADLDHAIALDRMGQAWTWGCNASDLLSAVGTLGEGEFVSQSGVGVIKLTGLPPLSDVAAGSSRMAVVGRDGKIRAWGVYRDGVIQYGDMKVGEVSGADTPRYIAAGDGAVFWIGDDGTAWQQGPGMFGYDKDDPGKVMKVGVDSPVSEISPGDFKVSVLTASGQIWTWGDNFGGFANPTLVRDH